MARPPDGFDLLTGDDGTLLLWRRREKALLAEVEPALLSMRRGSGAILAASGRGAVVRLETTSGGALAARAYRHGGVLGRWLGSRGIGWARAVAEIEASDAARAADVPTPEVLGVWFSRVPAADPVLVTRIVQGARVEELSRGSLRERRAAARALARCVATLLHAGLSHPDLNLTNFLVADDGGEASANVLDLDGARVAPPLSEAQKLAMVSRMARSFQKLRHGGLPLHARDAIAFLRELASRDADVGRRMPGLVRELGRPHRIRALLWSPSGQASLPGRRDQPKGSGGAS